jgi:carbon starvation protein
MTLLMIVIVSAVVLSLAYVTYGRVLARLLQLDPAATTPAVELRDDVDYVPIEPKFLLSQHFSAIAAAGPIVGPILAGVYFGWVPALLWILIGSIFIGGVHDFTSLVASIRHKARSIAEVVRDHMSGRAYMLFLAFVWLSLVYIIVAFTDVTAGAFLGFVELEGGEKTSILGGGIATSSLMYLALPIIMGLLLRYTRLSVGWATVIFLPLVGVSIWAGQEIPFDIQQIFDLSPANAKRVWNTALLGYCFIASLIPMWLLLQPRGHLGGYFLYLALGGGMIGMIVEGAVGQGEIQYHQFTGWDTPIGAIVPMLFVTIACGACSGFHSIIASGTTSKQLRRETDARVIGYGAMLLEAMVAVVSLCCVMKLAPGHSLLKRDPNYLYASGIGHFLTFLRIPEAFGVSFALMAFTTFVYDTLDVCTRLGRYILQELVGRHDKVTGWIATGLTAAVPLFFLLMPPTLDAKGNPIAAWKIYWNLFGASNQLLAALALIGVTVWLWQTRRAWWVWLVTGVPAALMYVMSTWALIAIIQKGFADQQKFPDRVNYDPVPWVGMVLIGLAVLMLAEAAWVIAGKGRPAPGPEALAAVE